MSQCQFYIDHGYDGRRCSGNAGQWWFCHHHKVHIEQHAYRMAKAIERGRRKHRRHEMHAYRKELDAKQRDQMNRSRVYFMEGTIIPLIKIGCSVDPESRLKQFPDHRLLGHYGGDQTEERRVHARFAHQRVGGEWFAPTPALMKFIEESLDMGGET